jgi:PAS domain S-box-containing protein
MGETWGLLIDWIGNHYTETIIDRAMDFCAANDVSLAVMTIGHLSYTLQSDAFDQFLFPVTSSRHIQRYLVASSQISSHGGRAVLEHHLERLAPKPVVCLGDSSGRWPTAHSHIRTAFEQLLDHLYFVHGYRRLAWLGGAPDNLESQERKELFLNYLADHVLARDESVILDGNFTYSSGKQAAEILAALRDRWEVVVAANDTMAVAVRDALGPEVPITGFDNSPMALEHGFTTVDPELGRLTEQALRMLSDGADAAGAPVQGRLVVRHSCGCAPDVSERRQPPGFDQSTERIGVMAQSILRCGGMEDLERYLDDQLPREGFHFWELISVDGPDREIAAEYLTGPSPLIVLALAIDADLYGFLLLDLSSRDYLFAEWLRVHITLLLQSWHKQNAGIQVRKTLSLEIERLQRRRTDIESVVNSLPIWIIETDRQFRIRYLNKAGAELLGISIADIRGRPFLDFVAPRHHEAASADLARSRDGKQRSRRQFFLRDKAGRELPVVCEIEALPDVRSVNLSTLFGSLSFEGGVRLTGLDVRDPGSPGLNNSFFEDFGFSVRQRAVLEALAEGLAVAEIAGRLQVAAATVRVQIHLIYAKTGVRDRQSLTRLMEDYRNQALFGPQ